jgi:serine/threonine protein kinase
MGERAMGQETEPRFTLGAAAAQDDRALARHDRAHVLGARYELGDVLGSGGTATVYEAWDRSAERSVAVKLFHPGSARADKHRQAEELRILSTLHHPDLIALHDTGIHDGRPFLVMQLIAGPTLAGQILHGPFPSDETTEIGARLARALAYVHAQGVTHRDVKPANVLLGPDGPKLGDFGIAHAFDGTRVTSTGVVVGTAAYLSPEQVRGDPVGPPADVFALGLVLLECLSGNREYPGPLAESAVARLHRSPVIPDGVSRGFGSLLKRMTALDPSSRPTANEVADRLAAMNEGGSTVASDTTARITAVAGRWRSRLLPVGAPIAAVSAAALALMFLSGADPGTPAEDGAEATDVPTIGAPPSTLWDVMSPSRTGEPSTSPAPVTTEATAAPGKGPPQGGSGRPAEGNRPAKKEGGKPGGEPGELPGNADDEAHENVDKKPGGPGRGKGRGGEEA